MSATYFWDGKQLIAVPEQIWLNNCEPYLNMLCVDGYASNETDRYGQFRDDAHRELWWKYVKPTDFPKEFRTQLLLLGVS